MPRFRSRLDGTSRQASIGCGLCTEQHERELEERLLWRQNEFLDIDTGMTREQIIATLRAHEPHLRRRGVLHAALFGSIARADAKPNSDIDILIEIEPQAPVGLFEYVEITQYLADLFPNRVDIANRGKLKEFVRAGAERDAINAF